MASRSPMKKQAQAEVGKALAEHPFFNLPDSSIIQGNTGDIKLLSISANQKIFLLVPSQSHITIRQLAVEQTVKAYATTTFEEFRVVFTDRFLKPNQFTQLKVNSTGTRLLLFSSSALAIVELPGAMRAQSTCSWVYKAPAGKEVIQADWHPLSPDHITVLSSFPKLSVYNVRKPATAAEQEYVIGTQTQLAGFTFGGHHGWEAYTVYLLRVDGHISALCPVVPIGASLKLGALRELEVEPHSPEAGDWVTRVLNLPAAGGHTVRFAMHPSLRAAAKHWVSCGADTQAARATALITSPTLARPSCFLRTSNDSNVDVILGLNEVYPYFDAQRSDRRPLNQSLVLITRVQLRDRLNLPSASTQGVKRDKGKGKVASSLSSQLAFEAARAGDKEAFESALVRLLQASNLEGGEERRIRVHADLVDPYSFIVLLPYSDKTNQECTSLAELRLPSLSDLADAYQAGLVPSADQGDQSIYREILKVVVQGGSTAPVECSVIASHPAGVLGFGLISPLQGRQGVVLWDSHPCDHPQSSSVTSSSSPSTALAALAIANPHCASCIPLKPETSYASLRPLESHFAALRVQKSAKGQDILAIPELPPFNALSLLPSQALRIQLPSTTASIREAKWRELYTQCTGAFAALKQAGDAVEQRTALLFALISKSSDTLKGMYATADRLAQQNEELKRSYKKAAAQNDDLKARLLKLQPNITAAHHATRSASERRFIEAVEHQEGEMKSILDRATKAKWRVEELVSQQSEINEVDDLVTTPKDGHMLQLETPASRSPPSLFSSLALVMDRPAQELREQCAACGSDSTYLPAFRQAAKLAGLSIENYTARLRTDLQGGEPELGLLARLVGMEISALTPYSFTQKNFLPDTDGAVQRRVFLVFHDHKYFALAHSTGAAVFGSQDEEAEVQARRFAEELIGNVSGYTPDSTWQNINSGRKGVDLRPRLESHRDTLQTQMIDIRGLLATIGELESKIRSAPQSYPLLESH